MNISVDEGNSDLKTSCYTKNRQQLMHFFLQVLKICILQTYLVNQPDLALLSISFVCLHLVSHFAHHINTKLFYKILQ